MRRHKATTISLSARLRLLHGDRVGLHLFNFFERDGLDCHHLGFAEHFAEVALFRVHEASLWQDFGQFFLRPLGTGKS